MPKRLNLHMKSWLPMLKLIPISPVQKQLVLILFLIKVLVALPMLAMLAGRFQQLGSRFDRLDYLLEGFTQGLVERNLGFRFLVVLVAIVFVAAKAVIPASGRTIW